MKIYTWVIIKDGKIAHLVNQETPISRHTGPSICGNFVGKLYIFGSETHDECPTCNPDYFHLQMAKVAICQDCENIRTMVELAK
jgi:hypothetical protein